MMLTSRLLVRLIAKDTVSLYDLMTVCLPCRRMTLGSIRCLLDGVA